MGKVAKRNNLKTAKRLARYKNDPDSQNNRKSLKSNFKKGGPKSKFQHHEGGSSDQPRAKNKNAGRAKPRKQDIDELIVQKTNKKKGKKKKMNSKWAKKDEEEEDSDFEEVKEEDFTGFPGKTNAADEAFGESSEDDDEGDVENLIRQQNRKKKKSGGFQSMGLLYTIMRQYLAILSFILFLGLSRPVYNGNFVPSSQVPIKHRAR
jgi:ATP-dependent RNA helicase DDX54/DBP10